MNGFRQEVLTGYTDSQATGTLTAMATRYRICLALTVWLLTSSRALPQRAVELKADEAIVRVENRWLGAEVDPDVLMSILADDFVHVLPTGFITKDEQIRYLRVHPARKRESKHFETLRVRVYGAAAVPNGIVVASSEDGKIQKTIFTDVFAYRNGKWQAVNGQETPLAYSPGQ
jgi:hypothetical protein